ncbi:MAG: hypothetical protein KAX49_02770 [Halanaerobiales bacterium]|nr:hypothetical protein [Halanaerobiales bacterium]
MYKDYINEIKKIAIKSIDNNYHVCITGKNMSGKSDALIAILNEYLERNNPCYFIDTVNRVIFNSEAFPNFDENELSIYLGKPRDILNRRVNTKYFNKIDVFAGGEHNAGAYYSFQFLINSLEDKQFHKLLKEFLSDFNVGIELISDKNEIVFTMNQEEVVASSGYQALLRIFIEIYYATKYDVKIVVIDEIDEHLDNKMSRTIINKLNDIFPEIKIITTVHSLTFFEELENTKIIVLDGDSYSYKILDSRDLGNLEYINREVFNSYIERNTGISKMEQLYMKVFNDIDLTSEDKKYLIHAERLSQKEKSIKDIILEEIKLDD